MLRNLLLTRLKMGETDEFEIEALGLDLLGLSLSSLHPVAGALPGRASARRVRAVERVKDAIARAPADRWTIAGLANIANLSPFHLCRVFRRIVGASVYDYVLHERLAGTLDAVLDGSDLTMIALDAGFTSHSHFTERFRRFFGCTPMVLRRAATSRNIGELRRIMTARQDRLSLN